MKITRPVAVAMVIVMLLSILSSCSSFRNNPDIVKEDDPWYETTRIELNRNMKPTDSVADSVLCTCKDRF